MTEIEYVCGDLFGPVATDTGEGAIIIPHVCNSYGRWGAGFVLSLGKTFPKSKYAYLSWYNNRNKATDECGNPPFSIGETQFVNIDDKVIVANMVAQVLGGSRPLYYNHLCRCMDTVAKFAIKRSESREYPARIICPAFGSGLAKGNWSFIEQLIEDCWLRQDIQVSVYYLPNTLPEVENKRKTSYLPLKEACTVVLGGIGALSPDFYDTAIHKIASLCGREVNNELYDDVSDILKSMPCPLD